MIAINNSSGGRIKKEFFSTVAKKILSGENKRTKTLSLAFVKKEEIKKINRKFRKKNKPTDVLSFELSAEGGYLGEIVICPEVVRKNAERYGIPVKKEMVKVFIHGILHLLGHDHEKSEKQAKAMEEKENFYLQKLIK